MKAATAKLHCCLIIQPDAFARIRTRRRPVRRLAFLSIGLCALIGLVALHGTAAADSLNVNPVADTFILSSAADNNNGGTTGVAVGRDGSLGTRRGLWRFDVSAIPPGATITSAVLRLTVTGVPGLPVNSTFDLHRLQAAWGEGNKAGGFPGNSGQPASAGEATWNSRLHGTAAWTAPGALADAAASPSASTPVTGVGNYTWSGASVISDVQLWVDDPAQNHGWLLRSQNETSSRTARDYGSRETVSPGLLQIGYTPPAVVISDPIAERVPKGDLTIEVETVADGMASPLGMSMPDDGSNRMFVHDQNGLVWVITGAGRLETPLLDMRSRLVTLGAYDERGLLGFAIHPGFALNSKVYTYSSEPLSGLADFQNGLGSTNNHHSVIAEWQISAGNSNSVDLASRREILRIDQPQGNHNGGNMHFGPDGQLYVVIGDGGAAHDVAPGHVPGGNGQASNNIWGTMIRIDVDGTNSANGQYGIPADNPFVGTNGVDEIYAYGFRNPFSFSFDSLTGDLYLGDVGQGKIEEIDVVTPGGNYGWSVKEGTFWFDGAGNIVSAPVRPVPPDLIDPIAMYDHDDGLAIIGGYVYRGSALGALAGRYVFGDWGSFFAPSGRLFYLDATNGVKEFKLGSEDRTLGLWLKGWGQGSDGELYVLCSKALGPSGATGRMLKLVPAPDPIEITEAASSGAGLLQAGWTGGAGPFAVQRKNAMSNLLWVDEAVTPDASRTLPADGQSGFVRVSDVAHTPSIPLSAHLAGDFENPPVATAASGSGLFGLDGNTLTFSVAYTGLSGAASAAHIHGPAGVGTNGPVLINLAPYAGSANGSMGTYSGVMVLTDSQKALLLSGLTYVNIHTAAHASGELRGQIVPTLMEIELSGANERPAPVNTDGRGLGTVTLVGNTLSLNLTYADLKASATAAHIHGPATTEQPAGVLVDLGGLVDGAFGTNGSFSGALTLSPANLAHVIKGLTYVNIHTSAHGGGEIRGQIVPKSSAVPFTSFLSGLAERPVPVTNSAAGSGTFALEGNRLVFNIQYESLSGTAAAAHIHGPSSASDFAGVLIDLSPFNGSGFGTSGTFSGTVVLTPEQRNHVLGGQTYVNIHTAANPPGELRGQIVPVLMTSHLSGINERPTSNTSPGTGLGVVALAVNALHVVVAYNDLTASATGSHIHGPSSLFGTAGVLVDLGSLNGGAFGSSGFLSGTTTVTSDQVGYLVDGQTYLNLHTSTHPSGEIRGQILR